MQRIIISAPFGNWLEFDGMTSTLGTFTVKHRGGLPYRLWRMLLTLRYHWKINGWTNKLGLPNPGIDSVSKWDGVEQPNTKLSNKIISVHGFDKSDWDILSLKLLSILKRSGVYRTPIPAAVELNLSCPNVNHHHSIADVLEAIALLQTIPLKIIAKLPPIRWMDFAIPLYSAGVRYFHLCNTIPTPGGGLSGKPLKQYSLWAVEEIKQKWGNDVVAIGGGGITHQEDMDDFIKAGADHCAIGSALLNPFNWRRLKRLNFQTKQLQIETPLQPYRA